MIDAHKLTNDFSVGAADCGSGSICLEIVRLTFRGIAPYTWVDLLSS
jgi:hypothetical protein